MTQSAIMSCMCLTQWYSEKSHLTLMHRPYGASATNAEVLNKPSLRVHFTEGSLKTESAFPVRGDLPAKFPRPLISDGITSFCQSTLVGTRPWNALLEI